MPDKLAKFAAALDALRSRAPPARRPPRVEPRCPYRPQAPADLSDPDEVEWHRLRAAGVPAGSETRRIAELRRRLMDSGRWRIVYES